MSNEPKFKSSPWTRAFFSDCIDSTTYSTSTMEAELSRDDKQELHSALHTCSSENDEAITIAATSRGDDDESANDTVDHEKNSLLDVSNESTDYSTIQ